MANNENNKIDKDELQKELDEIKTDPDSETEEMSADLKGLLKKEISDFRKREKTRGAEMLSIFAAHNYYANGFTPVELRTTLEDLGPTYVKIGQIMSSRVDLLPEASSSRKPARRSTRSIRSSATSPSAQRLWVRYTMPY